MMSTPDISDKFPELHCLVGFNSYGANSVFEGEVITVVCPDDNSLAKELISQKGDGKILFIEGNASKAVALLGDNLAQQALDNDWSGIVVNGMVRDVEILRTIPIAIYARGSCPKKSNKNNAGNIGVDVCIDGVDIKPTFWSYGDENGILISPTKLEL
ncbi:MAG: ribonuclease E activity regulator RraA [Proteobacteria bacterium]|nr:ribonuclease E activity regulator RraA [Pseudomonadota bacterium]